MHIKFRVFGINRRGEDDQLSADDTESCDSYMVLMQWGRGSARLLDWLELARAMPGCGRTLMCGIEMAQLTRTGY